MTCDDTRTLKFTLIVQRSAAEDLGGDLGLFGASGRRFLDALVAGERSPKALAALGDPRLKATPQQLAAALTGRFREVHAFEIAMHLRLIDAINDEVARLDARIEQQLASIPGVAPACTACGLIGGGHAPGCASKDAAVLGLVERLDEITGVGARNAQGIIAGPGTDMSGFPTPLGQCVMAASRTGTRLGEQYRRTARRRGKQKAIVAVSRVICEIACILTARFTDPAPATTTPRTPHARPVPESARSNGSTPA